MLIDVLQSQNIKNTGIEFAGLIQNIFGKYTKNMNKKSIMGIKNVNI